MTSINKLKEMKTNVEGKVMVPIIMYVLGVPGIVCIMIWAFFFRGK